MSAIALAHMGDAVYETLVRTWLCVHGTATGKDLHRATIALVCAPAQAEKMQDSSLLVMASAPDRMENANTASVISHRRRASRPPAVALSRKQTASTGKKSVPARRAVAHRTSGNSRTAVRSSGGTRYTLG